MDGKKVSKKEREKREKNLSLRSMEFGSSEQKAKSIHALRATRGYQNLGVSSNSTR